MKVEKDGDVASLDWSDSWDGIIANEYTFYDGV